MRFTTIILLAAALAMGCESPKDTSTPEKPRVVATTTMLADLVSQLGGDDIIVDGIMRPGGDPHLYQPRPQDAQKMAKADLIVTNGLQLEGWLEGLARSSRRPGVPLAVAADAIEPIRAENAPGGVDPHFWFDLNRWGHASKHVEDAIVEVLDEAAAARTRTRGKHYREKVEAVDQWTRDLLATIPDDHRVLVTSHDAFQYFGARYGIRVVSIQGISTDAEASQRDVINTIDVVRRHKVPAVFVESSVNPALVKQVARETGVSVAGPLYSDSIGPPDSNANTFLKTVSENVRMIVEGLGGTFEPSADLVRSAL